MIRKPHHGDASQFALIGEAWAKAAKALKENEPVLKEIKIAPGMMGAFTFVLSLAGVEEVKELEPIEQGFEYLPRVSGWGGVTVKEDWMHSYGTCVAELVYADGARRFYDWSLGSWVPEIRLDVDPDRQ